MLEKKLHDPQSFKALTPEEAQEFLESFLQITEKRWLEMAPALQREGIATEYKIENLEPVFLWVFERLKTVPREEDPEVPDWIRKTDDYKRDLFDFDDESEKLIFGLSYFFGEAFVRSFSGLRWSSGNREYLQCNQPVITKFQHDTELTPHNNIHAIFRRSIKKGEIQKHVSNMIRAWVSNVIR